MPDLIITLEADEVVTVQETVEVLTFTEAGTRGQPGAAATINPGTVTTLSPGSPATVTNSGSTSAAVFDFGIPRGDKGDPGDNGVPIELQKTATHIQWRYVGDVSWTNLIALVDISGTDGTDGDDGAAATIAVGTVTTGAPGSSAAVSNAGTTSAAVFNFTIPRGNAGSDGIDGDDGREIELQSGGVYIQWRYVGAGAWINLVALSAITGPPGTTGAGITAGISTIDFGATPSNEASVTITGQTGILITSTVDACIMARSTADNTLSDHQFAALSMRLSVSQPIADTGFTITAYNLIGFATGTFQINWRWS